MSLILDKLREHPQMMEEPWPPEVEAEIEKEWTKRILHRDGARSEVQNDPVFRPDHYTQWKQEPLTFLILNRVPFAEGCVIKYVMRWRKKNGIEDLRKARRITDMLIEMEEHESDYVAKKTCL